MPWIVVVITTKPHWAVHDTFALAGRQALPTREVHVTAQQWLVDSDVDLEDNPYITDVMRRSTSLEFGITRLRRRPSPDLMGSKPQRARGKRGRAAT